MRKLSLWFFATLLSTTIYAQELQKAIDLFRNNQRSEAYAVLQKIGSGNDKAYADLLMTLIDADNGHYLAALKHYEDFTQIYPNSAPYTYALTTSGIFTQEESLNSPDAKIFWTTILEDKKYDVSTTGLAAEKIGDIYAGKGDVKESNKYYAMLKDVKNWSTVGVFDNTSGSGFNRDFGALAHPEADYSFTNKTGALVKWFSIPVPRNDRWWDLEYHFDVTNSIIYVQTFIESDADRDVVLMCGVSGSMKVWLNDYLVASEDEERNTDNDVYNYKVKLAKGVNRLLLQVGSSEIERNNYMIRITDLEGNLLDLPSQPFANNYHKATPYTVTQIPFFAEQYFEEKLKNDPDNLIDLILLNNVYNHNEKKHEARTVAAKLKTLAPKSTLVSEEIIETLNRDNNYLDAAKEIESIKMNDPESLYGVILRYNDAENKEDWDEALSILNRWIELYGDNAETETKMLTIYNKKNEPAKVLEIVNKSYARWPDNTTFVIYKYFVTLNTDKDLRKANDILKNYLKRNYNEKIYEQVIENYFKLGEKQTGLKMYKKLVEDKPYAIAYYIDLASAYYNLHDYDEALLWQQKVIDIAPYVGRFYYNKALILESVNKKTEAYDVMKKAIYYSPTNYDARAKLRAYEGKKDLFSQLAENNAQAIYKDALAKNAYPDEDAVFLLSDQSQIVYPENGASEEKYEYLIQVLTQTGINSYKEVSLPYNSYTQKLIIDKTELLKKDGSIVTADNDGNELVFSTLEKGDAIHITYKLQNAYSGKLAEHFWEEYNINGGNPVSIARYSLIVPANKNFKYKTYNTTLEPAVKDIDDYKMYVWEKKDVPGIKSESFMPPSADYAERVVVSSIPDWSYVANWYSDLSYIKTKADYEVKEKVKELLDGKKNLTDLEKAKIIYEYIEQNFNYSNVSFLHSAFVPQKASRTLTAKLGDCKDLATLFVSMGREAGLDVNLILVDTRDNGWQSLDLPSIGFNHCIAQLHADNKDYLIELTDNHLPFGTLTYHLLNANALYIPKDGAHVQNATLQKLNTPNRPENTVLRLSQLDMNGSQAKILRKSWRVGNEAALMRERYKDVNEEDRNKQLVSSLSDEFNKNIQLAFFKLNNVDNLKDTMDFEYQFTVDNYVSDIVGMHVFKIPWADAGSFQRLVSLDARQYPLDIWSLYATPLYKETIMVNIPQGKNLAEIPKNISLSCSAMQYDLKYEIKDHKLIATREVRYLKDKVTPEEYVAFKSFVAQMTDADAKQYAFK